MAFLFFLEISILSLGDKESRGEVRTPRFCLSPRGILPKNQNGINRFYWIESAPRMSEPVAPPPPPGPPPPPAFDDGAEKKRKRDTYYDKQEVPRTPTASPLQPPAVAAKAAATPPLTAPDAFLLPAESWSCTRGTRDSVFPPSHPPPLFPPLSPTLSLSTDFFHTPLTLPTSPPLTPSHALSPPLIPSHPFHPTRPVHPTRPFHLFPPISTHSLPPQGPGAAHSKG